MNDGAKNKISSKTFTFLMLWEVWVGAGCGLEDYDGNSVSRFCEGGWSDILRCFFLSKL